MNWNGTLTSDFTTLQSVYFINQDTGWISGNYPDPFTSTGLIYKTTNGGVSWNTTIIPTWDNYKSVYFVDSYHGWAVGSGILVKTTNGGTDWTLQNIGFGNWQSVYFADPKNGWVVGENGKIIHTADGGINWTTQTSGTSTYLTSVFFTDQNTGWVVGMGGTILKTTNAGLPVELISFLAEHYEKGVKLTWSTATEVNNYGFEVQKSAVRGQQSEWGKIGFVQGNGNSNATKLYFFIDDKVSTGKYLYRLKQIDTDGSFEYSNEIEIEVSTPNKFSLEQNYPNPFNPITKIKYSIPVTGLVNLKVFDILGREVKTLVNELKPAGNYETEFNAGNLASGIYLYRITAGNFKATKKLILIK